MAYTADPFCTKLKKATTTEIESRGRWWATLGTCVASDSDGGLLVVCPVKLQMGDRFARDLAAYFRDPPIIASEASLESGRLDYVFRGTSALGGEHTMAVEVQALDTTGSLDAAKAAFEAGASDFFEKDFRFGFNWKMSIKTIVVQLLSKLSETHALGWSYAIILQDAFLAKMQELYDMKVTDMTMAPPEDVFRRAVGGDLLIHAYSLVPGRATHVMRGPKRYLVTRSQLIEMLQFPGEPVRAAQSVQEAIRRRGRSLLAADRLREHLKRCGLPSDLEDSLLSELQVV